MTKDELIEILQNDNSIPADAKIRNVNPSSVSGSDVSIIFETSYGLEEVMCWRS
jgi:hypothetical protein